jgi:carboxylate-amine ligase
LSSPRSFPAFSACGIELEYMLVDRSRLDVRAVAPEALALLDGDDCEPGLGWSNELVAHVIELKNLQPSSAFQPLLEAMQREVRRANSVLSALDVRLMPTAMHPRMDPEAETRLWPDDPQHIYSTYDRIFGCNGHGWSNLQSMHVNLPFANDEEFVRLHAAIRVLLPILPALAASSPIAEGRVTGYLDTRMDAYRANAARIPSIAGSLVPEAVRSRDEYMSRILQPMYADIAPLDPEGVLQHEWLNSRGAIARFDRNAIEIRVLDSQECVAADLAIAGVILAVTRALYEQTWSPVENQQALTTDSLVRIFSGCVRDADAAIIDSQAYLGALGFAGPSCTACELWTSLIDRVPRDAAFFTEGAQALLRRMLAGGCLARRMLASLGPVPRALRIQEMCESLCDCLEHGRLFEAGRASAGPLNRGTRGPQPATRTL